MSPMHRPTRWLGHHPGVRAHLVATPRAMVHRRRKDFAFARPKDRLPPGVPPRPAQ